MVVSSVIAVTVVVTDHSSEKYVGSVPTYYAAVRLYLYVTLTFQARNWRQLLLLCGAFTPIFSTFLILS